MPDYEEMFDEIQRRFCRENGYDCLPTTLEAMIGYAVETEGQLPINGLRHPPEGYTNGWFIWCGENLSKADDFFSSFQTSNIFHHCLEIIKFLGMPPGYRFLLAGDYLDIWYDESLLDISAGDEN
jgi:hypothetical protein